MEFWLKVIWLLLVQTELGEEISFIYFEDGGRRKKKAFLSAMLEERGLIIDSSKRMVACDQLCLKVASSLATLVGRSNNNQTYFQAAASPIKCGTSNMTHFSRNETSVQ